mmetsp:Transcript_10564/g.31889  ORF Transcript_10564/g.31889 Transcript_10564/m.31889 type:complete len:203 (+) Transcript_10564:1046-1654(+)
MLRRDLAVGRAVRSQRLRRGRRHGRIEEDLKIRGRRVAPVRRLAAAAHYGRMTGAPVALAQILSVTDDERKGRHGSVHLVVPAVLRLRLLAAELRVVVHEPDHIAGRVAAVLAEVEHLVQAAHVLVVPKLLHTRSREQHEPPVHAAASSLGVQFGLHARLERPPEIRDEVLHTSRRRRLNARLVGLGVLRPDPVRPNLHLCG